jgi:hypothetical protein
MKYILFIYLCGVIVIGYQLEENSSIALAKSHQVNDDDEGSKYYIYTPIIQAINVSRWKM